MIEQTENTAVIYFVIQSEFKGSRVAQAGSLPCRRLITCESMIVGCSCRLPIGDTAG
jgi:hypothetical protein